MKACEAKPYEHVSAADICRVDGLAHDLYDHYTGRCPSAEAVLPEDITPALEGLWFGSGSDSRAVARHLADIYARNGRALIDPLLATVSGRGDPASSVSAKHVVRFCRLGARTHR